MSSMLSVIAAGTGGLTLFQAFRALTKKEELLATPISKTRSAALGGIKLEGVARYAALVESPASRQSCCYWHAVLEAPSKNGWIVVHRMASQDPFYLEDSTGRLLIDPKSAETSAHLTGMFDLIDLKPPYSRTFEIYKITDWLKGSTDRRIVEHCIFDGDALFVTGDLQTRRTAAGEDQAFLSATKEFPFIITTSDQQLYTQRLNNLSWMGLLLGSCLIGDSIYLALVDSANAMPRGYSIVLIITVIGYWFKI